MQSNNLHKLGKTDLLEIIYEQEKRIQKLQEENKELEKKLKDKSIKIKDSGSIAEATLKLNEIFENAQKAADEYLRSVKEQNPIIQDYVEKEESITKEKLESNIDTKEHLSLILVKNNKIQIKKEKLIIIIKIFIINVLSKMKKMMQSGSKAAKRHFKNCSYKISKFLKNVINQIKVKSKNIKKKLQKKIQVVKEKLKERKEKTLELIKEIKPKVSSKIDEIKQKFKKIIEQIERKSKKLIEQFKQKFRKLIEQIKQKSIKIIEKLKKMLINLKDFFKKSSIKSVKDTGEKSLREFKKSKENVKNLIKISKEKILKSPKEKNQSYSKNNPDDKEKIKKTKKEKFDAKNYKISISSLEKEIKRRKNIESKRKSIRTIVFSIVVIIAFAIILASRVFYILQVNGNSMETTLYSGDLLLTSRLFGFNKGDMIAFYYNDNVLIKRVIATEEDIVNIDDSGNVYVNNEKLEENYVDELNYGNCDVTFPYRVPSSCVFVLRR